MVRWGGAPIIGERGLPLIGGTLVEEGHPLVGEGHTQMSFRRAKMPLLVGLYFIPPLSALTLLETLSRQQQTHQSELESLKNRLSVQEGEVAGLKQENARLKYRETLSESRIERLEKTIVK